MAIGTEIFSVEAVPVGRLFIMPRPQKLPEDIHYYQSLGVTLVVSLVEAHEAETLGLGTEAEVCRTAGLGFLSFPIADFTVPERTLFLGCVNDLVARLHDGEAIAVHCRAGIGRSGMVVCSVLGALGVADAIEVVGRARGVEVPDTAEQRAFIESILAEFA